MKKALVFLILTVALLLCLTSCKHGHIFGEWSVTKNATCTEDGVKTRYCDCGEKQSDPIPAIGHEEQTTPATEATCTKTGLTEGKKCSDCGETLVVQQEIPMIAHTYDDKYDESCNVCGFIRDAECAHRETEVVMGYSATCTTPGLTDGKKCTDCGDVVVAQRDIPATGHTEVDIEAKEPTCIFPGYTTGSYCSGCGEDIVPVTEVPATGHTDSDTGFCTVCDAALTVTEGVLYDISADGTYAEVVGYKGSATSILIASEYQGLPVTNISNEAFIDNTTIRNVTIPDSVTSIGERAFGACYSLTSIEISDSVTSIGEMAFAFCTSLTSIIIPDGVTDIGYYAFSGCTSLTSVVIGDGVTSIGAAAFYNCSSLTSIVIPDSVTSIDDKAFYGCTSLTSVVIGDGVTSIGAAAFYNCSFHSVVTFADPDGWYVTKTIGAASGTNLTLTKPSTNASYLMHVYVDYYWYKR